MVGFQSLQQSSTLLQHCDFVFVTPDLHKDFDSFEEVETSPNKSFLPPVELLDYWIARRPIPSPTVVKYSKRYLNLRSSEWMNYVSGYMGGGIKHCGGYDGRSQ